MKKVFTIARREYFAMVGTKAFLFTVSMMPILMFGSLFLGNTVSKMSNVTDKEVVVIDQSGKLFELLRAKSEARNKALEKSRREVDGDGEESTPFVGAAPKFLLRQEKHAELTDEIRYELSTRIRNGEIHAFVEIRDDVHETVDPLDEQPSVVFHAQNPTISPVRRWLATSISSIIRAQRLRDLNIDPAIVQVASTPVRFDAVGLTKRTSSGEIKKAAKKDTMVSMLLPFGIMMLMFMIIFLAAQPMLESVLEEKSDRIAEVLLGSANPFQLMLGKLLGNVAGSICVFLTYLLGGYFLAVYRGWSDFIPFEIAPWFIAYQIVAVLFFSSIFMAVGASVSQLKEAQSMLLPVWLVLMLPMFVWFHAVRDPNGAVAVWMSFFPPATPLMMVLRLSTETTVPIWQPIAGLAVMIVSTLFCLFLAGRIFRIGILWQGKTPRIGEIMRWAFKG